MKRECLVKRFAEIQLRNIVRMSILVEVRKNTVRIFEHWVSPLSWDVVSLFRFQ